MVNSHGNISLSRENSLFLMKEGMCSLGKANRGRLGLGDDFLQNEIEILIELI